MKTLNPKLHRHRPQITTIYQKTKQKTQKRSLKDKSMRASSDREWVQRHLSAWLHKSGHLLRSGETCKATSGRIIGKTNWETRQQRQQNADHKQPSGETRRQAERHIWRQSCKKQGSSGSGGAKRRSATPSLRIIGFHLSGERN